MKTLDGNGVPREQYTYEPNRTQGVRQETERSAVILMTCLAPGVAMCMVSA